MAEEQLGDRTVGVRKTEEILPVGTVLTAVGELYSAVGHPDAFKVRGSSQPTDVDLMACPDMHGSSSPPAGDASYQPAERSGLCPAQLADKVHLHTLHTCSASSIRTPSAARAGAC